MLGTTTTIRTNGWRCKCTRCSDIEKRCLTLVHACTRSRGKHTYMYIYMCEVVCVCVFLHCSQLYIIVGWMCRVPKCCCILFEPACYTLLPVVYVPIIRWRLVVKSVERIQNILSHHHATIVDIVGVVWIKWTAKYSYREGVAIEKINDISLNVYARPCV